MWINTRQPSDETRIHFVLPGFLQTRRSAGARMPTSVPRPPNLHSGVHVLHLARSDQTASQMIWTAMLTPEIKGLASPNPALPSTCFTAAPFYFIFFGFWCAPCTERRTHSMFLHHLQRLGSFFNLSCHSLSVLRQHIWNFAVFMSSVWQDHVSRKSFLLHLMFQVFLSASPDFGRFHVRSLFHLVCMLLHLSAVFGSFSHHTGYECGCMCTR